MTARLSRRFYERFGDEIVQELVDLLNTLDVTYRNELREQNETNFARFDARLEQRIAELRGELRTEMQSLKADMLKWMFVFWTTTLAAILLR